MNDNPIVPTSPTVVSGRDQAYVEFLKTLRLGFVLRSTFALFAFAVCLLLRSARLLEFNPWALAAIVAFELFVNQSWPWYVRRLRTVEGLRNLTRVHIACDIAAVSLSLLIAGGLRVAFINLAYIFLILWAGFFISARACYITASASAAAYALVLSAQYLHKFQPFAVFSEASPVPLGLLTLAAGLGHAAALMLVAYFVAKTHELLATSQQAQRQTVALKADLDHTFRQLVRSEKLAATGELAAGMAHEICNPLTAIAGLAESILLHPHGVPPKIAEMLRAIRAQAEQASAVVRRLLGFARPAEPTLTPCSLNEIIGEALSMVRYKADFQKISLELGLDPHLPSILGDHAQLTEVCINLFLNAVQAMPTGGHLRIVTRVPSVGLVELQVTDTGCGIPAAHLPRIFDPFFTTKPPGEGTGLGLSVTHSILQRHCGTIDVKSQPGHGTTFFIRLPTDLSKVTPTAAGLSATIIDLTKSMANPSILVVDDDETVCGMLAQFLVDNGYQATMAHSGTEALALVPTQQPDLVLLDLEMAGMDGVECLRQLKAHHASLPVVVVTAVDDETIAQQCLTLGAVEYLVKPVSLEHLRRVLTIHLRHHRLPKAQNQ